MCKVDPKTSCEIRRALNNQNTGKVVKSKPKYDTQDIKR